MAIETILLGALPLSIGGIISLLLTTVIIFVAIVLSDKILSHEMDTKHVLIMSFLCAFIVPLITSLVTSFISFPAGFSQIFFFGMPLVSWIILGEILLEGDFKQKIIVAFIAFAIFTALQMFGIAGIIRSFIPF